MGKSIKDFFRECYNVEKVTEYCFIIDYIKTRFSDNKAIPLNMIDFEDAIRNKSIDVNIGLFDLLNMTDNNQVKNQVFKLLVLSKKDKKKVAKIICNELISFIDSELTIELERYVWSLCDKLLTLRVKDYIDDYCQIASCTSLGSARQLLILLIGKVGNENVIPLLVELTEDTTVDGHALQALCNFNGEKITEVAIRFLKDDRVWVRKAAIRSIRGRFCD